MCVGGGCGGGKVWGVQVGRCSSQPPVSTTESSAVKAECVATRVALELDFISRGHHCVAGLERKTPAFPRCLSVSGICECTTLPRACCHSQQARQREAKGKGFVGNVCVGGCQLLNHLLRCQQRVH